MVYKSVRKQRKYQRDYKYALRHGQKFKNPFKGGTWRGPKPSKKGWHGALAGNRPHEPWTNIGKLCTTRARPKARLVNRKRNAIRGSF